MFIFDTDIYTNVMRNVPSEALLNHLKKVPRRDQFTTTITIAEVYYGLMKASNRKRLLKLFESVLLPRSTVLPFAFSAAKKYGEIRSFLEKTGTPLAHADTNCLNRFIHEYDINYRKPKTLSKSTTTNC